MNLSNPVTYHFIKKISSTIMNRPVENVVVASSQKDKEVQPRRVLVSSVSQQDIDSGFSPTPDKILYSAWHDNFLSDLLQLLLLESPVMESR